MLTKNDIFPIGIGTWGIGGMAQRDPHNDDAKQIDAMAYMFSKGLNFAEANMWYSQGKSVELLAEAFRSSGKKRSEIFICQAIYLNDPDSSLEKSKVEVNKVLELFDTDYVDTIQFSQGSFLKVGYEAITEFVNSLLETKKSRFTSITNADLTLLKQYHQQFGPKLFSHEVCFNFEIRANMELGIIPYAQDHDIMNVIYQPLRRNNTALRNWPLLVELAKKYGKTQNQVILNWIIDKGFLPLTKSENRVHIDEHLGALDFKLETTDVKRLDEFIPPGYKSPEIDWQKTGVGVRIDQLSNVFDENYHP